MRVPPPRILVVSGEQWPRALLRAQLDEAGYDPIGAGTCFAVVMGVVGGFLPAVRAAHLKIVDALRAS
ncbi:MAG TPA: hypothetical protein VEL50_04145 [Gemmatimonadales bacterium]|nr:hypothetical protein [Gemmatimonadales bacterium]